MVKDGGASSECREGESESDRYDVVLPKTYHELQVSLMLPWHILGIFQYTSFTMASSEL